MKKFLVIRPSENGIDKLGLFFAKDNNEAFFLAQEAFNDRVSGLASYPIDNLPDGWIFKL